MFMAQKSGQVITKAMNGMVAVRPNKIYLFIFGSYYHFVNVCYSI